MLNQAYRSALPAGAPAAVQASIVGAINDPVWIATARAALTHGASVALACGAVILLLVGVVAATLHHPGLRTGMVSTEAAEPDGAGVGAASPAAAT